MCKVMCIFVYIHCSKNVIILFTWNGKRVSKPLWILLQRRATFPEFYIFRCWLTIVTGKPVEESSDIVTLPEVMYLRAGLTLHCITTSHIAKLFELHSKRSLAKSTIPDGQILMRVFIYIKSSTWVECISESAQLPNDIYIFIYILKIQFKHAAYLHLYITCTSIMIVLSQFFQSEIYPSRPTRALSWRTSSGYNRVFTNMYQSDQSKLGKMQWSRPLWKIVSG